MTELEHKFEVSVETAETKQRISNELKKSLKSMDMMDDTGKLKLKGVSGKMLKRMKQEFVACPVLEEDTHFIKCFICPNFQSRVMGKVLCKGDSL